MKTDIFYKIFCLQQFPFVEYNSTMTDINKLWEDFKDICLHAIAAHVPTKMTLTRFHQLCVNQNIKSLSRYKKKAFRHVQQTGLRQDIQQEARWPRFAHLSDIATADMQMLCNIFPILSSQLMKISSF